VSFTNMSIGAGPMTNLRMRLATLALCCTISYSLTQSQHRKRPYVGYASAKNVQFIVVGTSHFRCNSAQEVQSVIDEVEPDGVVVELDPERAIRLTKEHAKQQQQQQWFGADFLSAIDVSIERNIPLFIGDEYNQETKSRFVNTIFSIQTYNPVKLLSAMNSSQVDFLQTFMEDPMKLVPLVPSLLAPLLFLIVSMIIGDNFHLMSTSNGNIDSLTTMCLVVVSIIVLSKMYNTLIADRDNILAARTWIAAEVLSSLQRNDTIRKTWSFPVKPVNPLGHNGGDDVSTTQPQSYNTKIPLFTLKTPLQIGAIRNLNLFEPRWLAMIDRIVFDQTTEGVLPQFGCVSCTNKFYSVVQTKDGEEGRYADIIFEPVARLATLTNVTEATRPSGARKILTQIKGEAEKVHLDENEISVSKEGYLITSVDQVAKETENRPGREKHSRRNKDGFLSQESLEGKTSPETESILNIVVVVGLLHVNGVIEILNSKK